MRRYIAIVHAAASLKLGILLKCYPAYPYILIKIQNLICL